MNLVTLLPQILLALGAGFLVANVLMGLELIRWWRRRSSALLVWAARKPPYYGEESLGRDQRDEDARSIQNDLRGFSRRHSLQ